MARTAGEAMTAPPPVTSTRYAVAVTLPGEAPFWVKHDRPLEVFTAGTRQQAEAQAKVLWEYYYTEPGTVVEARAVVVTVADAGRGEDSR